MCISVSVVVPSGNSSIGLGVGHCSSKLQVVEEFDRSNSWLQYLQASCVRPVMLFALGLMEKSGQDWKQVPATLIT